MAMTETSRLVPFVRRCLLVTLSLLATLVWSLAQAATDAVTIQGLPGVKVNASVISTDSSITDVPDPAQLGWQPLSQPLGRGFGEQVYWVRLVIEVPTQWLDTAMVLRFHPPNARDVKFLMPDGHSVALGTQAPFDQRILGFPDLAASFVATASPAVVNVRLATAGRMFGSFELMSERTYYQSQAWRTILHGVFYGMLLLALLVNMVNWAASRHAIYGLYLGFVGFSLMASLAVNGYLHALLFAGRPDHHSTFQLWVFVGMAATAIAFAARMLQLRAFHVRLERLADLLAAVLMVLALLASFWVILIPYVWECVLAAFFVYGMGSLVVSLRNLHQKPSLQNGLLAVAFMVFAVSQWVSMATVFGFLPATPINTGMWQIGLAIHLVLLQMALVNNSRQSRWRNWQQQARLDAFKAQAETEARRSRDLQLFLERLTHEFKTPLAVIDSSVQSLGMLEREHDPERDVRYGRIRRAVARLNDLLMRSVVAEKTTLNRPEGKRQLLQVSVMLEAVLAEFTSADFRCDRNCLIELDQAVRFGRAGQHQLRLSWIGDEQPDSLLIEAEASWLDAALYHIVDNAVKYSVGQREIALEIDQVDTEAGRQVVISISNHCDDAIAQSDLPKLFEKYYRKGEQGNVPGAGIGLYVARQAIQAQGGTLVARMLAPSLIQFEIKLPLVIRHP